MQGAESPFPARDGWNMIELPRRMVLTHGQSRMADNPPTNLVSSLGPRRAVCWCAADFQRITHRILQLDLLQTACRIFSSRSAPPTVSPASMTNTIIHPGSLQKPRSDPGAGCRLCPLYPSGHQAMSSMSSLLFSTLSSPLSVHCFGSQTYCSMWLPLSQLSFPRNCQSDLSKLHLWGSRPLKKFFNGSSLLSG